MSKKPAIFGKLGQPWLEGPFREYDTRTVQGLASVSGKCADVLAIVVKTPAHGDGGRFLEALQRNYETVRIWAVENPTLRSMLTRRGFVVSLERHLEGEELEIAYVWQKAVPEERPQ
jgi:hypothetical protein